MKAYRAALEVLTCERVPLDWATNAEQPWQRTCATSGERDSGTERLEQAVQAYRATLEVLTRERVPLQWATTQNNLGAALADPGRARERHRATGTGRPGLPRRT